jgi:predicted enzyme related to lactoylglutathione lyase
MAKILGIGGVFFRSADPKGVHAWYEKHLGLLKDENGVVTFAWKKASDEAKEHRTVWCPFPKDTDYFGPARPAFMVNYIVDDLDGMLADLRAAGAEVDQKVEEYDYGRFGWVTDPEGNRIELWQPAG